MHIRAVTTFGLSAAGVSGWLRLLTLLSLPLILLLSTEGGGALLQGLEWDLVAMAELDLVGWLPVAMTGAAALGWLSLSVGSAHGGTFQSGAAALGIAGDRRRRLLHHEIGFRSRHRLFGSIPHDRAGPQAGNLPPARVVGEPTLRAPISRPTIQTRAPGARRAPPWMTLTETKLPQLPIASLDVASDSRACAPHATRTAGRDLASRGAQGSRFDRPPRPPTCEPSPPLTLSCAPWSGGFTRAL